MFLASSCSSCLCTVHWSQVLSQEWRSSWSSSESRCSNYIWVITNFITWGVTYIRYLAIIMLIVVVSSLPVRLEDGFSSTLISLCLLENYYLIIDQQFSTNGYGLQSSYCALLTNISVINWITIACFNGLWSLFVKINYSYNELSVEIPYVTWISHLRMYVLFCRHKNIV